MKVEVLTFAGCPHAAPALDLVRDVVAELGVDADIEVVDVGDADEAQRLAFPGSPTVRVDGADVDPTPPAEVAYGCRVYPNGAGVPERDWIVSALTRAA